MIYHITTQKEWDNAKSSGKYKPAGFDKDKFIHCSEANQVADVANRIFKGRTDLIILQINKSKVKSEIRYEDLLKENKLFPHIYGLLEISAVEKVLEFKPNKEGFFEFKKNN